MANNIMIKIKTLPQTIKQMPEDKLIAWGAIVLGFILVIIAVVLW